MKFPRNFTSTFSSLLFFDNDVVAFVFEAWQHSTLFHHFSRSLSEKFYSICRVYCERILAKTTPGCRREKSER